MHYFIYWNFLPSWCYLSSSLNASGIMQIRNDRRRGVNPSKLILSLKPSDGWSAWEWGSTYTAFRPLCQTTRGWKSVESAHASPTIAVYHLSLKCLAHKPGPDHCSPSINSRNHLGVRPAGMADIVPGESAKRLVVILWDLSSQLASSSVPGSKNVLLPLNMMTVIMIVVES